MLLQKLLFNDFTPEIKKKTSKNEQKTVLIHFCLLFKAGWHANAGRLPEGYLKFVFYSWFFTFFNAFLTLFGYFYPKKLKIDKKTGILYGVESATLSPQDK